MCPILQLIQFVSFCVKVLTFEENMSVKPYN